MAFILSIETSDKICSVALSENSKLIGVRETELEKSHASQLTVLIEGLLRSSAIEISDLKAVAVSKGPGSYTGLRIGVSVAKGLCYGLNIPLIAINTLHFLKYGIFNTSEYNLLKKTHADFLICSMIDARRMEVYRALQKENGELIGEIMAEEVSSQSFQDFLTNNKIVFIGSGADKCQHIINHENAFFINGIRPLASQMTELSYQSFEHKKFENLAYFEPFYLKDFIATTSKKNLFNF